MSQGVDESALLASPRPGKRARPPDAVPSIRGPSSTSPRQDTPSLDDSPAPSSKRHHPDELVPTSTSSTSLCAPHVPEQVLLSSSTPLSESGPVANIVYQVFDSVDQSRREKTEQLLLWQENGMIPLSPSFFLFKIPLMGSLHSRRP